MAFQWGSEFGVDEDDDLNEEGQDKVCSNFNDYFYLFYFCIRHGNCSHIITVSV